MKRDPRLSRALVSGVGITLTLALVFWAYNLGKSHGTATPAPAQPQSPPRSLAAVIEPPGAPQPVQTPTTAPAFVASSQPVTPPILSATTQRSTDAAQVAAAKLIPSLAAAKMKFDAGKLLDARESAHAAMASGTLSDADTKAAKQLLNQINAKVVFSPQHFDTDQYGGTMSVPAGGRLEKIARTHEVTPDLLMRINGISDARKLKAGQELKIVKGPFNALVSKSNFTLELWLGDPGSKGALYVTSFPIGLGKDDSTPSGVWAVGNKLKNPAYYSPRGQGIIDADDPKNPLGDAWIALTGTEGQALGKTSYGIHGTIDPSSIGKKESMGCIRMRNEDVAQVYDALVDGKSIVVVRD